MEPARRYCTQLDGTFVSVSVMRHGQERKDQRKAKETGISLRSDYNEVKIYKRAARNFNGDYRTMF